MLVSPFRCAVPVLLTVVVGCSDDPDARELTAGGSFSTGATTMGETATNGSESASDTDETTGGMDTDSSDSSDSTDDGTTGEPLPPDVICEPWAMPSDAHDQSVVPVEVEPQDPNATKIVLVAGAPSVMQPQGAHEFFAGTAILAKLLCQTPGVVPVIVKNGWPTDESIFTGADAIVFYLDGAEKHPLTDPNKLAVLAEHIDAGAGFVNLHYAVDYAPALGAQILPWLGGYYEAGYSVNPIWTATFDEFPAHPVTTGVTALTIDEEWYYNMRWVEGEIGITRILEDVPPEETRTTPDTQAHPGRSEVTAWTYDRPDGGRGFGFTGGHWYGNWIDQPETPHAPMLRRVVVQGILWSAKHPIPPGGAPVDLDPADNGNYIDTK
ncbi:signal peptide prediction [Enhygromyxa salina]|uniref:Signal peptide prediction n=1 Tax=Enhygromyxa salina TaxID=215803 RepID=A0A0C1ZKD0_9BACT|nr:ThuA domain-containing protein [Enhygromyxa salina]KIG17959.1 signal peptide prediction [Enhygromyxa salina]